MKMKSMIWVIAAVIVTGAFAARDKQDPVDTTDEGTGGSVAPRVEVDEDGSVTVETSKPVASPTDGYGAQSTGQVYDSVDMDAISFSDLVLFE